MENIDDPDTPARDGAGAETDEENIEETLEESFPASDPPSYAGGRHRKRAEDAK